MQMLLRLILLVKLKKLENMHEKGRKMEICNAILMSGSQKDEGALWRSD
jgi:hypothetical protein